MFLSLHNDKNVECDSLKALPIALPGEGHSDGVNYTKKHTDKYE